MYGGAQWHLTGADPTSRSTQNTWLMNTEGLNLSIKQPWFQVTSQLENERVKSHGIEGQDSQTVHGRKWDGHFSWQKCLALT